MRRRSAQCRLVLANRVGRAAKRHVDGAALQRQECKSKKGAGHGWGTSMRRLLVHARCVAEQASGARLDARVGSPRLQLKRSRVCFERRSEAPKVLVAGGQPLPGRCRQGGHQKAGRGGGDQREDAEAAGVGVLRSPLLGVSSPQVHDQRLPARALAHPHASCTSDFSAAWKAVTPSS